MSTQDIIAAASDPTFYTRVSFISLKVAQQVAAEPEDAPNHENRAAYSNRIFTGADNALLLSQHIAASNPTIAATLETEGGDAVPDADIEFAMASIWDARSNAFAYKPAPPVPPIGTVIGTMPDEVAMTKRPSTSKKAK